jgi:hypothetical protein
MPKSAVSMILNPTLYADPAMWQQSLQTILERCIVLRDQAFDVLQKKCTRAFYGQRGDDVVDDQPAASGITHSLSNSHRRERLARKPSNITNHGLGVPGVAEC